MTRLMGLALGRDQKEGIVRSNFMRKDKGGAAIEYLVVSLMTLGLSVAIVKTVRQTIKEKIERWEASMGFEGASDEFNSQIERTDD